MVPFRLQGSGANMRGSDATSGSLFSCVDLEGRIPAKHPLRTIRGLVNDVLTSLDGTLVEAWASMRSFRAKDGPDEPPAPGRSGERGFHGETRANDTHESKTGPDAKLYKKGRGREAKLCFMGHALIENRHGLVV